MGGGIATLVFLLSHSCVLFEEVTAYRLYLHIVNKIGYGFCPDISLISDPDVHLFLHILQFFLK